MNGATNYPKKKEQSPRITQGISAVSRDLYFGFKFAIKHFLSYFLAMVGVIILTIIMLVAVLLIIVVPLILFVGFPVFVTWISSVTIEIGTLEGTMFIAIILMVVLPILGPFFVAIGALYGMSREIVESETTSAESAFSWYQKRAFSLVGGGMVHFLITLAPFLLAIYAIFVTPIPVPTNQQLSLILPVGFIWILLSNGMLVLTFPGIIDGLSAISAAKRSVRLCCRSPGRVLGAWSVFVVLVGIPFISLIDEPLFNWIQLIPDAYLDPFRVILVILILFLVLPAMSITFSRIYLILTAQDEAVYDADTDDEEYTIKLEVDNDES